MDTNPLARSFCLLIDWLILSQVHALLASYITTMIPVA